MKKIQKNNLLNITGGGLRCDWTISTLGYIGMVSHCKSEGVNSAGQKWMCESFSTWGGRVLSNRCSIIIKEEMNWN